LPTVTLGEKAIIAVVHPAVTVTKNFIANKNSNKEAPRYFKILKRTWCKVLPRNDLQHRFMIIERRFENSTSKYIITNSQKVQQWLHYLFKTTQQTFAWTLTTNNETDRLFEV